jgi:Uma2 family endonuclease
MQTAMSFVGDPQKIDYDDRNARTEVPMSIAEIKRDVTPEELLAMPDANNFELVDGELVERNMSVLSSWVETRASRLLGNHCDDKSLGAVMSSSLGYQCFQDDPRKVRKPDVSFISADRMTSDLFPEGYCPIAPALVVEVISPGDLAHEIVEKVEDYVGVGVRLIWVIDPEARVVDVYRPNGSNNRLNEADFLDGETVVSGFRCPVNSLFPDKSPPA